MSARVLGGRYELVAFIGRGGMGEVWEGRDRVIERRVAVKLLPHDRRDAAGVDLFFREARTAGGLSHAGVVTVYDLGQDPDDGALYLVMEYLDGRDLFTVLHDDGPPGVPTALDWAAQTASALAAAHAAGIVHRDLKPANLMLTPDGRIKVLDFGIARYVASTRQSSKVIGTVAYMPPERFGDQPADARSDLYSLGCVLHELLTGNTPFQATAPVAMMAAHLNTPPEAPSCSQSEVPAAVDELVLALLAKDPGDRPASAAEVWRMLSERPSTEGMSTAERPTQTTPAPTSVPAVPSTPHISRRTALLLAVGAGVAASGTTAALTLLDQGSSDDKSPGATGSSKPSTTSDAKLRDPRLRWRYATKDGLDSSPTVADGTVYAGCGEGKLYALDAATGREKWVHTTGGSIYASPVVAGGVVYVGSGDYSLYALDAATGKRKWAFATGAPVYMDPVVMDGVVFVSSKSTESFSDEGNLYAVHARTGRRKWKFDDGGDDDFSFSNSLTAPAAANGVVYIANFHSVYAIAAATGKQKWKFSEGGDHGSPVVKAGVVYVGSDEAVYALDATDGKKKWESVLEVEPEPSGGPSLRVADGVVYARYLVGNSVTDNDEGVLITLDAATGDKRWEFRAEGAVSEQPAVVDGIVYVGCENDKKVYALDAVTGNEKWSYATRDEIFSSPVVSDGTVYVGDRNHVYALNSATPKNKP
ncbi:serine/threonine-protein kinase [Streptomyces sp. NBC_01511]|uniref:serine/threonine-protein kinase n=1 Tax=unclassified Streptomyces TaxID=2593676 RepID=UPI00386323ED